jgi:hypothetical protein
MVVIIGASKILSGGIFLRFFKAVISFKLGYFFRILGAGLFVSAVVE